MYLNLRRPFQYVAMIVLLSYFHNLAMTSVEMSAQDEMVDQFLDYASRGDLDKVSTMISHSSQLLNESGRQGWTALMLAARNGHFEVVKALLSNG